MMVSFSIIEFVPILIIESVNVKIFIMEVVWEKEKKT